MNNLEQSYKKILEVLSKFFGKKLQDYQRRKLPHWFGWGIL